jgi:hypothetical protein
MADTLAEFEAFVSGLDGAAKAELDAMLAPELKALWTPDPRNEPQVKAYYSDAAVLLYGGSPGGGKSDLLIGLALTAHTRSVIFRRQATDLGDVAERMLQIAGREGWNGQDKVLRRGGRFIELGHLEKPGSEMTWQGGLGHDFIGFDEGAQLARAKVQFVLGWLRSTDPKQRRRTVIASNPPLGAEGYWLVEWFAPWLDPVFPQPAKPGELRWAAVAPTAEGRTVWLDNGDPIFFETEERHRKATSEEIEQAAGGDNDRVAQPMTRTFIPSKLRDNPYLANTGYLANIQALPEPNRTKLLNGDFLAGREDDEYQVIPTAWIEEAQARWTPNVPRIAMTAIGVDVAQGGDDLTVVAPRRGGWYAPLLRKRGKETQQGSDVAAMVVTVRCDNCPVIVDAGGGWGTDAVGALERNGIQTTSFKGLLPSVSTTRDGGLRFYNKRAESWWRFREDLNPDQPFGSAIALPKDASIRADLAAPRWELTARGIKIEDKAEIRKRLGRSPDDADAVVMCLDEGSKAARKQILSQEYDRRPKMAGVGFSDIKDRMRQR